MALRAEEAPRRDRGQELAVAVHEVRDRHHRRLALTGAGARVTGQAFVAVEIDLIAVDRMRDDRRLLRIVAHLFLDRIAGRRHARRRTFLVDRDGPAQSRLRLREEAGGAERERGGESSESDVLAHGRHTFSILQAHFLKSVCNEIGSVASSVTLLMSWPSSNQGTNTTLRGILL